jgi:hypothetical protein
MKNQFVEVRGTQCDRNGKIVNEGEESTFFINTDMIKAIDGQFVYLKEQSNVFQLTKEHYYTALHLTKDLLG